MTAVIYARYSSDSQREASIEGQLRDCKDYAEKNGITVVGTYIDRAYSAKTDDRPDFQRMIKDSGKKIFDVVLVWKLDRFARNRFDAVNYKYQLEKNGVHLVSAMEPISQGPEGIMVESMLIGMAEYYSAELALKVARGERENALQCKYNGGIVPLGFTIGKEDRLYHIDPETAPIVQEIFSRYADGEPAEKIAASLNERGLRTRTGKPFVKNSFFQIFRNRRYIGEYRYKDIVTPGGIPAIVDEDLFNRVQQRFEQNRIAHGRPAKEDVSYLLTTKLFCGKCGTLMGGESGTSHMGNTYYYYKCGNAKRHGKAHCDLKAIRKEPLERFVVDTAIKVIFSDEIIERLIDLVMEAQQKENTRLPVLKDQLRDTEKRLANLLEAIEQGILTPTTKQRLDELEARKEALNTSILEEELKKPVLTREWIRFWLEKFRKGDVGSTEHQRQIIDTFVNSVYVFDDRVVLNFNFTDDAKTVTREEVLGSSAVDNAPPYSLYPNPILCEKRVRVFLFCAAICGKRKFSMIQKHDLPILEYDFDSIEVIRPNHGAEQLVLPEKCVFGFLGDVIDDYAFEMDAVIAEHFETITKSYPVYIVQQNGLEFCLCQAPLGAATAAQLLDFLISCGCKKIISAGSCGVLTNLDENEFLIPIRAMRDEGTSYHYLPAARFVDLEPSAIKAIEQTFCALNIPFQKCITWTTDGFFRETRDMVEYRKSEGCATVEMECAALAACAQKRGAVFGQILYTADSLANVYAHDERDWGKGSLRKALELCINVLITM